MNNVTVRLPAEWICEETDMSALWFKGQMPRGGLARFHKSLRQGIETKGHIEREVAKLEGNFGFVMQTGKLTIAVTDHCNSVPILVGFLDGNEAYVIGSSGSNILSPLSLDSTDISPLAALSVAMSGYTIGNETLYPSIRILSPGSVAVFSEDRSWTVSSHHAYRPWDVQSGSRKQLKKMLTDELTGLIDRLIKSADGRPIVVPLSAGLDSRLIAAGLKEFGYRDVRCFSYGLKGNHETKTSCHVARELGYAWTFVPYSIRRQRDVYASADHRSFVASCDHLAGIHFEQEFLALRELTGREWIPKDAMVVNGQSGDFITGNHIPTAFHNGDTLRKTEKTSKRVADALVGRHFELWEFLATDEQKERVSSCLEAVLSSVESETRADFGLYEWSEFQDRQCKYVVQNVRVYEHFGYAWKMPLWDRNFMDFWAKTPLTARMNQNLYREVLKELDWGRVWQQIPVNNKVIRPHWIRPLRFAFKVLHAPLGRANWHAFERRVLSYWMSNLCSHAVVPYRDVIGDSRGHRSAISWWAKAYLSRKGLEFSNIEEWRSV